MKEKHELASRGPSRERASQRAEIAVAALRRLNYMIDVGFKRKLRSHRSSEAMRITAKDKDSFPRRKPLYEEAWEVRGAELIDNVLVFSILSVIKFDDTRDGRSHTPLRRHERYPAAYVQTRA